MTSHPCTWRSAGGGNTPTAPLIKLPLDRGADATAGYMRGWTPHDRSKGQFGFPEDLQEQLTP